jgi:hypothetical protein
MKTLLSTLILFIGLANISLACDAAKASSASHTAEAKTVSTCPMAKAAVADAQMKACDPTACMKGQQNLDARASQGNFEIKLASNDNYIQAEGKACSGMCAKSGGLLMFLLSFVLISGVINFVGKR